MIKDVSAWLKKAPPKSQIVEIQTGKVKDGKAETVKIIPQKIIETLLDELTEQNWSTKNFQFSRWNEMNVQYFDNAGNLEPPTVKRTMCDASLELVVTYRQMVISPLHDDSAPVLIEKEITRTLIGAYSFDVSLFGNDHIANTAKSLCISNAASDLGKRFGKDLNPKEASMMILGMKQPVQINGQVTKDKISETLSKLTDDLKSKK